jgi:enediyne polyketide synthase
MKEIIEVGDVAMVVAQADDAASLARVLAEDSPRAEFGAGTSTAGSDSAGGGRTGGPPATATQVGSAAGGFWRAVFPAWPVAASRRGTALLAQWLAEGRTAAWDTWNGVHLRQLTVRPSIGLLFPGQGSPARDSGGLLAEVLPAVAELYRRANLAPMPPPGSPGPPVDTALTQPAIVTASLAGRLALEAIGLPAGSVAVGHSLGELSALAWAGAIDDADVVDVARARGSIMSAYGVPGTAMASVAAAPELIETVRAALGEPADVSARPAEVGGGDSGDVASAAPAGPADTRPRAWPAWVACRNGAEQTVVAGSRLGVGALVRALDARGVRSVYLPVSHAFHTPMVGGAVEPLRRRLAGQRLGPVRRPVVSTVTGGFLGPDDDLRDLLARQITEPVSFMDALRLAATGVDAWVEVGPGRVLSGLATHLTDVPAVSLDAGSTSWQGLASVVALALALGLPVDLAAFGSRGGGSGRTAGPARPLSEASEPGPLAPVSSAPARVGQADR